MWFLLDRGSRRRTARSRCCRRSRPSRSSPRSCAAGSGRRRRRIDGAFALYEHLRTTLDDIPRARVEEVCAEIARLARWLGDALGRLEDLRRVKQVVV